MVLVVLDVVLVVLEVVLEVLEVVLEVLELVLEVLEVVLEVLEGVLEVLRVVLEVLEEHRSPTGALEALEEGYRSSHGALQELWRSSTGPEGSPGGLKAHTWHTNLICFLKFLMNFLWNWQRSKTQITK